MEHTAVIPPRSAQVEYGDERDPPMPEFSPQDFPVTQGTGITKPLLIIQGPKTRA